VGIVAPNDSTTTPESRSFEGSTDISLAGANSAYLYPSNPVDNDLGETAAGQPSVATDIHSCMTGSGESAKTYAILWSAQANAILMFTRTGAGAWSAAITVCSTSVNASVLPAAGAVPQPRIAAVGNLVHVVWSRLNQAAEPVQVAHVWSTDGGTTWIIGQSFVPQTKVNAAGVHRLQVALHSSGEVWLSCQKRNQDLSPRPIADHTSGVLVGFLPTTATASTAWVQPDPTYRADADADSGRGGELCIANAQGFLFGNSERNLLRAPSIFPLGSGKAYLSCVYVPAGVQQCQLYAVPIKVDTLVRWDLPSAAFNLIAGDVEPHSNVASLPWLNTNGYAGIALG
jgi:hypothetical protein